MASKIRAVILATLMISAVFAGTLTFSGVSAAAGNTIVVDEALETTNATHKTTITAAVEDAEVGDTIEVKPGTYNESVTVDTAEITLNGPNEGISGDAERGPEATVLGQVVLSGPGTVLDGFDVSPPPASNNSEGEAVRVSNTPDDVVVRNNIVRDFKQATGGTGGFEGMYGINVFGGKENDSIKNITIADNKITNIKRTDSNGGAAGISIQGNVDTATVTNNAVDNIGQQETPFGFGVVVRGTGNHDKTPKNIAIRGNRIDSVLSDPASKFDGVGIGLESGSAADVVFENNDISNTNLLLEDKTATVDLGGFIASNTIDRGAFVQNVENSNKPVIRVYNTTQRAVYAASPGDTVEVRSGTYGESVTVNVTDVTLEGPNAGLDGTSGDRGPEAVITGADGTGLKIAADGVTVDGLQIESTGIHGVRFGPDTVPSDVTIQNNVITDIPGSTFASQAAGNGIQFQFNNVTNKTAKNIRILNNTISNITTPDASGDTEAIGVNILPRGNNISVDVIGNTFTGISPGSSTGDGDAEARGVSADTQDDNGNGFGRVDGITVSHNSFTDFSATDGIKAIALLEDGGLSPREGVKNFEITQNTFDDFDSADPVALFVGGYEDLGDDHRVARNDILDGVVVRFNENQDGFTPGEEDSLDATLNWWGDAQASNAAVAGNVTFDPFLTVPKNETPENVSETQQFAHDLVIPRDGELHSIAFPGPVQGTVGEVFGFEDTNRGLESGETLFAYDAANETWLFGADLAEREVSSLDAFVVSTNEAADDPVRVTVDFEDASGSTPPVPGGTTLSEGWNFVGAPTHGPVSGAFGATTGELGRIVHLFAGPQSQPFTNGGVPPTEFSPAGPESSTGVTAFTGYWVFMNQDGELAGVLAPGATAGSTEVALTAE